MSTITIAVVGTGENPEDPGRDGFAMAYRHAKAYDRIDGCRLVACADLVPENASAFADEWGIDADRVYEDYRRMLREAKPDLLSVCVPPAVHADVVIGAARTDSVEAIHCEKPMAQTWGDSKRMAQECSRRDVSLTFNHQRRLSEPVQRAVDLVEDGEIGPVEQVEFAASNLFDYGSHSFDICGRFAGDVPGKWVLSGVDYRRENVYFGAHNENQAIVSWEYENGIRGLAATGDHGTGVVGAHNRIVGAEGVVELKPGYPADGGGPQVRVRRDSGDTGRWETVPCNEGMNGQDPLDRALEEVVESVQAGEASTLDARNALNATELIFAAWESVRRRGRVDLPLDIEDNPLESMVESGDLRPEPVEE